MPEKPCENLSSPTQTATLPAPPRWVLAAVGAAVAAVYLACVHGQWWPTSDSALYVGLGRSLAEGGGYQFNWAFCNYVTPGLPWLYAACHALAGQYSFWLAHLAITLCGLASLWLIYATFARLTGGWTALAVATMTAGSQLFFHHAHVFLTDVPFLPIFWGMMYVSVRYLQQPHWKFAAWAGALAAMSVVLRAPGLTVVLPLAAALLLQFRAKADFPRRLAMAAVIFVFACGTAGAFYWISKKAVATTPPYLAVTAQKPTPQVLSDPIDAVKGVAQLISWPLASDAQRSAGGQFRRSVDQWRTTTGLWLLALGALGLARMFLRRQFLLPVTLLVSAGLLLMLRGDTRDLPARYLLPLGPIMSLAVIWGALWTIEIVVTAWRKTSGESSADYRFDLKPRAATTKAPSLSSTPLPREFALPRWVVASVTALLLAATLAGNAFPTAERFKQHAYFGHGGRGENDQQPIRILESSPSTDVFLRHIGSGSFEGLFKMAALAGQTPPEAGPVVCSYPEMRILHLLTRRRMACPGEEDDLIQKASEMRRFMDRVGGKYAVVGDEDVAANVRLAKDLVAADDFHQVSYENSCYFFERIAPVVSEGPATKDATTTTSAPVSP